MPERTTYRHGTPSWVDLASPDLSASKDFYGTILGWDYDDRDNDQPGVSYTMALLDGKPVAGMMPHSAEAGFPPVWSTYVHVDDVDATTAKAEPAGGQVLVPPMDVMDQGRMSFLMDPTGAAIGCWQPGVHTGAAVVNEPGALCWDELITPDVDAAAAFYAAVFGWHAQPGPMGDMAYTMFAIGPSPEDGVAGAMNPPMPGIPPHWAVYFAVADADATVADAAAKGATVVAPPMDIPVGRMAALLDPTGVPFSIVALSERPS